MDAPKKVSAADIESVIRSLANIASARVVMSKTGVIEEIHVLADSVRPAKQVVRNVESALMAALNLPLDHKKVSVAQTQNGKHLKFNESRLKFSDVAISLNGARAEATVRLKSNGDISTGTAVGHSSSHSQLRLIATATLRAVEDRNRSDGNLVLEDVSAGVTLSGQSIVVVLVAMTTPRGEDHLTGAAIVRQDLWKAVVNATLDAVNRRLGDNNESNNDRAPLETTDAQD